jgi:hypothetical protein
MYAAVQVRLARFIVLRYDGKVCHD